MPECGAKTNRGRECRQSVNFGLPCPYHEKPKFSEVWTMLLDGTAAVCVLCPTCESYYPPLLGRHVCAKGRGVSSIA